MGGEGEGGGGGRGGLLLLLHRSAGIGLDWIGLERPARVDAAPVDWLGCRWAWLRAACAAALSRRRHGAFGGGWIVRRRRAGVFRSSASSLAGLLCSNKRRERGVSQGTQQQYQTWERPGIEYVLSKVGKSACPGRRGRAFWLPDSLGLWRWPMCVCSFLRLISERRRRRSAFSFALRVLLIPFSINQSSMLRIPRIVLFPIHRLYLSSPRSTPSEPVKQHHTDQTPFIHSLSSPADQPTNQSFFALRFPPLSSSPSPGSSKW